MVPARAARGAVPRRAAAAARARRHPRRPALPHDLVGRPRERRWRWAAPPATRGYDYLAICDHTPAVGAVQGLTADDVRRQAEEIAAANEALAPFRVLRGIECDILPDGRLDLPDDVLAELDWVQASVHGGQRMPAPEMTRRVVEAISHPHVSCLSHPTGPADRPPPRERGRPRPRLRGRPRARRRGRGQRAARPARPARRARPRRDRGRREDRLLDRRARPGAARLHGARGPHGAPRRRDGRRRRQRRSGRRALGFARWRRSFSTATPSATRPSGMRSGSRSSTRCCSRSRTGARRSSPARSSPRASRRRAPTPSSCCSTSSASTRCSPTARRATRRSSRSSCAPCGGGGSSGRSCPPDLPVAVADKLRDAGVGIDVDGKAVEARRRARPRPSSRASAAPSAPPSAGWRPAER